MNVADRPGKLVPGLATSWEVDGSDKTRWRFTLRPGVKFHDGSAFDADAVIWNLDKVLKEDAPHFDKRQSAQVRPRLPSVKSWAKLDGMTVEITTKEVDSFFPYQMLWFLVSSPTQYERLGRDWTSFRPSPPATGPFRLTRLEPRQFAELTKNAEYWDKSRSRRSTNWCWCEFRRHCSARTLSLPAGRSYRDAGTRHRTAAEAGRSSNRPERDAARLELSSFNGGGLALD
jgi:ABC-type transport system substrate-binding protein